MNDGNGLLGKYYNDKHLIQLNQARIDATIDFNRDNSPVSLPQHKFSIRWTGFITPLYSEIYTFYTLSDDGVRLWIDHKQLINQWITQPLTEKKGNLSLLAGKRYPIRIDYYYENEGVATIRLLWSSPQQSKQVVPQSQLSSI